jgi:Sec7-like guanine-nucleotide exchange factor
MIDLKQGDRLATVSRSNGKIVDATIYTVDRVSATAKTGWLNTGDRFKLSNPYISGKFVNSRLEPVTPEIEAANDRRIQEEREKHFRQSEMSRLYRLVSKIQVGGFKCLSPESITRIANAIQKELT